MADDENNQLSRDEKIKKLLEKMADDALAQPSSEGPIFSQENTGAISPSSPPYAQAPVEMPEPKSRDLNQRIDEDGAGQVFKEELTKGAKTAIDYASQGLILLGKGLGKVAGDLTTQGLEGAPRRWKRQIEESSVGEAVNDLASRVKAAYTSVIEDVDKNSRSEDGTFKTSKVAGHLVEKAASVVEKGVRGVLDNVVGDPAVTYATPEDLKTKYGVIGSAFKTEEKLTKAKTSDCKKFLRTMEKALVDKEFKHFREPIYSTIVGYACDNMGSLKELMSKEGPIYSSVLESENLKRKGK